MVFVLIGYALSDSQVSPAPGRGFWDRIGATLEFLVENWWQLFIAAAIAAFVALFLARLLAIGMTKPLRDMAQATTEMAQGDYSVRVETASRDEVGQLATAFNRMSGELADVERLRRDLVANVSHELKTPLVGAAGAPGEPPGRRRAAGPGDPAGHAPADRPARAAGGPAARPVAPRVRRRAAGARARPARAARGPGAPEVGSPQAVVGACTFAAGWTTTSRPCGPTGSGSTRSCSTCSTTPCGSPRRAATSP